jgi:beta-glucosidase-like glycosyl hydrolase/CubicO group peptidase (beta-lactamase class C family)
MKSMLRILILAISLLAVIGLAGHLKQTSHKLPNVAIDPPFLGAGKKWVDSLMQKLTPEQRMAQLFMVAAYSNKGKEHQDEITRLIKNQQIGGLIFMQGGPLREAKLTNAYQKISNVPLMISIDGEWGLSMRLDSTQSFPKQMTLGAIRNDSLVYRMGLEIARQCRRMGIHVNFAPVADVNNNPSNPVINMRSFGENKYNVTAKAFAYMKGLQDGNVLANAKHFPGHGDTDTDSHKALPIIKHNRERLDSIELYPFRELIAKGLGSMMVAHLYIPALDSTKNQPSTLSKKIITELLRDQMGFKGLIFTDALNMQGVAAANQPGIADVKALLAGNDVMLFSENVPLAIAEFKKAIEKGQITQEEIDRRCRKILEAKYWMGLHKRKEVTTKNLYDDLHTAEAELIRRQLTEASLCVLENKNCIPLRGLDSLRIAAIAIDGNVNNTFQKTLNQYALVKGFAVDKDQLGAQQNALLEKLKPYNVVIVSVHNPKNSMSKNAGVNAAVSQFVAALNKRTRVILCHFANPYALEKLSDAAIPKGLIQAFEDNKNSQDLSAQLIFGGIKANGQMPVNAGKYKFGDGLQTADACRLKFTIPEELGIQSADLDRVDSIARYAIRQKATPGCQLLIAKDGKVFYNKTFGFHTYAPTHPVEETDLYDIASITKVAASTVSIMKLVDEGFINVDKTVGDYIPAMNLTNKGQLRLRDLLAHQAGLPAWIPFYTKTVSSEAKRRKYYRSERSDSFPLQVAENLYLRYDYPDSMLVQLAACEITTRNPEYKYSDLGYYFFKYIIEKHKQKSLAQYAHETFYGPLGMARTTFNPLTKFERDEIIPTENDKLFRKQLVHGYVHDQGAAMMGGVGGHAGLFSTATDLAALMQMILNYGTYGGDRYLSEAVIKEFTRCQFCENDNRRGLGFDKPEMNYGKTGPTCKCVSSLSFGHTGFTGTIAWADPDKKLIYIFLSNRVYPDAENKKINTLATRVEIQEAIYSLL